MIRSLVACTLLVAHTLCAPVPLEEEFNIFSTKQENHEQRFIRVDHNKDKSVTFDEFLHMELAYVEAKKEEFESLDKNKDGKVSLSEYEEHFHEASNKNEKSRTAYFAKVFEDFDEDFNMALSQDELERVLAERFLVKPRENFPKLFYKFDIDHSGGLDLTEYMKFDANFPFDQTDPIGATPLKGTKTALKGSQPGPNRGPAGGGSGSGAGSTDADRAAIAAVMAQASPTFNQAVPAAAASQPAAGLHPVAPSAHHSAVPIKKI